MNDRLDANKFIELENDKKTVFVGDTHGDYKTTQQLVEKYPIPEHRFVFLGDYVDRGLYSQQNIDYLLKLRQEYPRNVYLLKGNHEAYPVIECSPSNFWQSLSNPDFQKYAEIFIKFPLVISVGNIIALHGVLPDIDNLAEIDDIDVSNPDDEKLFAVLWGDFIEQEGEFFGPDVFGRPKFGKGWFRRIMNKLNKKILIKSHNKKANLKMFDDRCITIFSTTYYNVPKRIVMLEPNKAALTADDLQIIEI